jgi:hypothetical protein
MPHILRLTPTFQANDYRSPIESVGNAAGTRPARLMG